MLKSKDLKILFEATNKELVRAQVEKFNSKNLSDVIVLNRKINELKGALGRLSNTIGYAKKHQI